MNTFIVYTINQIMMIDFYYRFFFRNVLVKHVQKSQISSAFKDGNIVSYQVYNTFK